MSKLLGVFNARRTTELKVGNSYKRGIVANIQSRPIISVALCQNQGILAESILTEQARFARSISSCLKIFANGFNQFAITGIAIKLPEERTT